MQTDKFHSMRHHCYPVQHAGTLGNCSTFAFELPNPFLFQAMRVTRKRLQNVLWKTN